jgi:hypothetical protein
MSFEIKCGANRAAQVVIFHGFVTS